MTVNFPWTYSDVAWKNAQLLRCSVLSVSESSTAFDDWWTNCTAGGEREKLIMETYKKIMLRLSSMCTYFSHISHCSRRILYTSRHTRFHPMLTTFDCCLLLSYPLRRLYFPSNSAVVYPHTIIPHVELPTDTSSAANTTPKMINKAIIQERYHFVSHRHCVCVGIVCELSDSSVLSLALFLSLVVDRVSQ